MDANTKTIIDKYDVGGNGMFSPEDVQDIANDMDKADNSSSTKRKIIISASVLVMIVSAMDRAFVGSNDRVTFLSESDVDDGSIRHLQANDNYFDDWIACEGLATVPSSYVNGGTDSSMVYVCNPTDTVRCDDDAPTTSPTLSSTASPTESMSPTRHPTETPTAQPTATITDAPTESPTKTPTEMPTKSIAPTLSPTNAPTGNPSEAAIICYNQFNLNQGGDASQSCAWLDGVDNKLELCDTDINVRETCPVACGICCEDNPDYIFDTEFWGQKDCAYISAVNGRNTLYCTGDTLTYCAAACSDISAAEVCFL